ncbi:hypothetical protein R50345_03395 [Paenibacillus sp. FSL R5-0345]|uniref:restriction endonuclease subunit S n=1 Tax=Paenibacillus sp. FSL R5-0345 TaxID=1536770 RepID=UPI0004F62AC3|nr:restriction endonuclease subunit S [Paenibacillus sp. FSL R5-0345]AIQ33777.1 hypothetical protein R50345_03395 [Paenibacillus sp. FSL R5-0345]
MSKWEMIKLGEVCDVRDGTHDSPKYVDHGYPLVTSKNVANGYIDITNVNYISKEDYNKIIVRSGVDDGDIIMPMIGTIGNPVVVRKTFDFAIKNVALVKFIRNNVLNKYIYYVLSSDIFRKYIEKENRGGTQKFISLSNIRNFFIPLPPLEIQKKIAKTLDTAAELLAMRKQQLAELDNLIKSTFYVMFGDPVRNKMGWNKIKILDIAKVETGSTPSRNNIEYYIEGSVPWVKTSEISKGYIFSAQEKISEKAIKETNCKLFPENTILVAMYGQGKTRGQAGILKIEAATNQACAAILPNQGYITEFLFRFLQMKYEDLRGLGRGGNQQNLNLSIVKNFEIIFPPIELQTQFANIITKIEEQKSLVKQAIDETQYLFDSLMSEYFE